MKIDEMLPILGLSAAAIFALFYAYGRSVGCTDGDIYRAIDRENVEVRTISIGCGLVQYTEIAKGNEE